LAFLSEDEGEAGSATYMNLGAGLNRPRGSETDPPAFLHWTTAPLTHVQLKLPGAHAYIVKSAVSTFSTYLIPAVRSVVEGKTFLSKLS
jgi:hypothetical protein